MRPINGRQIGSGCSQRARIRLINEIVSRSAKTTLTGLVDRWAGLQPMSTPQAESERALFRVFAEAVELPIALDSIESRNPPEPDIRCMIGDAGPRCFELVEIIDSDLARAIGIQVEFQARLANDALARHVKGLSDALVFVGFSRSSTNAQKQQACEELLSILQQLPDGFRGSIDPATHARLLAGVVRRLRVTRGDFAGPVFQVDGATFVSDPIIAHIREKFAKEYKANAPIDLLAFYQTHPTFRAEYELPGVDDYVGAHIEDSPFSRVWVFDAENRKLLYRY